MRPSIFIVFAFLSCAAAARVKVRSHSRFSSRGDSCQVLAKWICQPKTYEANLGQVKECCKSSKCGSEELRQTCCQLAGMEDEGVNNVTVVTPIEKPVVVEKDPENIVAESIDANDLTEEILDPSPKTSVDYELFSEFVQQLWMQIDIQPNLEKELEQAFYASKKPTKLSWSMSCVAQCEGVDTGGDSCESLGGQCQAVQTEEDCKAAGAKLSKSFFAYDPKKSHMASEMERFPRGCFVKMGKTNTNIVRWNPPRPGENVKLNNVCGCYKDK